VIITENNISQFSYDVIICGSGPAGVSLALDLETKGINSIIIEAGDKFYNDTSQKIYEGEVNGNFPSDLSLLRLSQFGGTTGHWGGTCRHLDEYDFTNWPLNKKQLENYKIATNKFLELKTNFGEKKISNNLKIIEFCNSEVRVYDKYFKHIEKSKNIFLILNTSITEIFLKDKIVESILIKTPSEEKKIKSKILVMACGGIENVRLLLWFREKNKFLLKKSPIGKYWMEHPFKIIGSGVANFTKVRENLKNNFYAFNNFRNWGNFTVSLAPTKEMIEKKKILNSGVFLTLHDRDNNTLKNNIKDLLCLAPKLSTQLIDLFNKKLLCGLSLSSSWEQDPEASNNIILTNNLDNRGIPKIKLNYKLSNKSINTAKEMVKEIGEYFISNNLGRIALDEDNLNPNEFISDAGYHHIGGTRMGLNENYSVVDQNLKVFGIENFFVLGSSVFPSGGHANPTYTIVQLSYRLSDHLKKII
jgi:hypothetical protein